MTVASETLHTLRFKRDGVEFEMTAAPEDVAAAWSSLQQSVIESFAGTTAERIQQHQQERPIGDRNQDRTPKRTRKKGNSSAAAAEKASHLPTLLSAQVDDFPDIGEDPPALFAGYATLQWAHAKLGIDGLTADDIQRFLQQKLRLKATSNAYRVAFRKQPRAVDASNDRPARYQLMRPGASALDAYLRSVKQGASSAEAEAAGRKAEEEADAE